MRLRLAACVAAIVAAFVAAVPGGAQPRPSRMSQRLLASDLPVELTADSLEYEAPREIYIARGNVRIRQGDLELRATWIAFSNRTRRGVASGDVLFTDGTDTLHTSFVEFELDTLQGVMFDAEFDVASNQLEMRGAEIARTGERTYHFKKGEFTACRCPDPEAREPWELKAGEADLELEGYGTARNTTLEVLGVPVLWLPWMIYPLKTERQSGLLFPDLKLSGRNGAEVGLPIFWAAGDPVNVVLTPRWLQKRGFKGDLDVEYVLGEASGGEVFGSFIHDTEVDEDSLETPFDENRWATRGEHDLFLPGDWRFQTTYAFASDNSHSNDFDDLRRYRAERFLPAVANVGRRFGASGAFGAALGARYADDIMNPDDTDRDDFVVQTLPEARLDAAPFALPFAPWIVPAVDVQYAWLQPLDRPQDRYGRDLLVSADGRFLDTGIDGLPTAAGGAFVEQGRNGQSDPPDPNFDDFDALTNPGGTEGDGRFQEGELIADSGHRFVFMPRLAAPFRVADVVEVYPEVGWHQTLYASDAEGFEQRGLLTGRVDVRSRLRRDYGRVSHLFEPRVGWAFVSDVSQSGNPLYVPATAVPQRRLRDLDLDNVTRDTADRIDEFNGVAVGFGNRVYRRPGGPGEAARLLADVTLSGLYDFADSDFGSIYLDGRAYPFRGATARFNVGFDPSETHVTEGMAALAWQDQRGDRFTFGYRFLRDVPRFFEAFPRRNDRFDNFREEIERINQLDGGVRVALTDHWALTYRGAYTFETGNLLANEGGVEYLSRCRCWAVRVEVSGSRARGAQISVLYTLVGLGDDSRTPFASDSVMPGWGLLDGL